MRFKIRVFIFVISNFLLCVSPSLSQPQIGVHYARDLTKIIYFPENIDSHNYFISQHIESKDQKKWGNRVGLSFAQSFFENRFIIQCGIERLKKNIVIYASDTNYQWGPRHPPEIMVIPTFLSYYYFGVPVIFKYNKSFDNFFVSFGFGGEYSYLFGIDKADYPSKEKQGGSSLEKNTNQLAALSSFDFGYMFEKCSLGMMIEYDKALFIKPYHYYRSLEVGIRYSYIFDKKANKNLAP